MKRLGPPQSGCQASLEGAVAWREEVARREPQSPLRITFILPPATLRLSGVVDDSTHAVLTRALARATRSPHFALAIDLSGIEYCDLAGLRAIVSLATRDAPPRQVVLASLPAETDAVLRILGWHTTPGLILRYARTGDCSA